MNSTEPQLLDSLPYFDNDLERFPGLKEKVDREFARQPKPPATLHPGVPPEYQLFTKNPLLQAEFARVESHEKVTPLDTIRYQLPAPSLPGTDDEWQAALKNAHAQLEHQRMRQTNLTLLQTYGGNAWRIHNYLLESTVKQTEQTLEELKQMTVDVNRERKNAQTKLGSQLNSLETRWTELISSVLQIELANVALDNEVNMLNAREAELHVTVTDVTDVVSQ
ncbi:breast carcinoma amplified sequence 2 [Roridomyces roridus]|uniref:Breast carcinoma amplified sequence 2 n=1 Tax=Roridomyces roridus TaxID=1738132 RepID=A0AAD7FL21_9AGAR|nr:breast carcinoma amplified sequence 2 [Roridomyces roridus]